MVDYRSSGILTANPGDRIAQKSQTIEEKAKQLAVNKVDMTGVPLKVPTYFIVKYPDGTTEALHHIKDAQKISDVIRQMEFDKNDKPLDEEKVTHSSNFNGLITIINLSILLLLIITTIVVIGIF